VTKGWTALSRKARWTILLGIAAIAALICGPTHHWTILGWIFVGMALFSVHQATKLGLGPASSRLLALVLGAVAYYDFGDRSNRHMLPFRVEQNNWYGSHDWMQWIVLAVFLGLGVWYFSRVKKKLWEEIVAVVTSSGPLLMAVGFLIAAAYTFSL